MKDRTISHGFYDMKSIGKSQVFFAMLFRISGTPGKFKCISTGENMVSKVGTPQLGHHG